MCFSGTKQQEIVVSRGKILELLRPDPNTGKVHTLLTVEVFGVIQSRVAQKTTLWLAVTQVGLLFWNTSHLRICLRRFTKKPLARVDAAALFLASS